MSNNFAMAQPSTWEPAGILRFRVARPPPYYICIAQGAPGTPCHVRISRVDESHGLRILANLSRDADRATLMNRLEEVAQRFLCYAHQSQARGQVVEWAREIDDWKERHPEDKAVEEGDIRRSDTSKPPQAPVVSNTSVPVCQLASGTATTATSTDSAASLFYTATPQAPQRPPAFAATRNGPETSGYSADSHPDPHRPAPSQPARQTPRRTAPAITIGTLGAEASTYSASRPSPRRSAPAVSFNHAGANENTPTPSLQPPETPRLRPARGMRLRDGQHASATSFWRSSWPSGPLFSEIQRARRNAISLGDQRVVTDSPSLEPGLSSAMDSRANFVSRSQGGQRPSSILDPPRRPDPSSHGSVRLADQGESNHQSRPQTSRRQREQEDYLVFGPGAQSQRRRPNQYVTSEEVPSQWRTSQSEVPEPTATRSPTAGFPESSLRETLEPAVLTEDTIASRSPRSDQAIISSADLEGIFQQRLAYPTAGAQLVGSESEASRPETPSVSAEEIRASTRLSVTEDFRQQQLAMFQRIEYRHRLAQAQQAAYLQQPETWEDEQVAMRQYFQRFSGLARLTLTRRTRNRASNAPFSGYGYTYTEHPELFPQSGTAATSVDPEIDRERRMEQLRGHSCPICYEDFVNPHETPCGHIFCHHCVVGWVDGRSHCPACRRPVMPGTLRMLEQSEIQAANEATEGSQSC